MTIVRKYIEELPEGSYTEIPKELILDKNIKPFTVTVYGYASYLLSKDIDPTVTVIAEGLGSTPRRVVTALRELEEADWISKVSYDY